MTVSLPGWFSGVPHEVGGIPENQPGRVFGQRAVSRWAISVRERTPSRAKTFRRW